MDFPATHVRAVAARAARRALARSMISRAGLCGATGAFAGLVLVAAAKAGIFSMGRAWPLVAGPVIAGAVAGVLWALAARWSLQRAAHWLDRQLGLKDRLGAALELEPRAAQDPFVAVAIGQADEVARSVDVAAALPMRWGRSWWWLGVAASGAIVVAVWVPQRDPRSDREPAAVRERQRAADQVRAVLPTPTDPAEPPPAPAVQRELEAVNELERELARGASTPEEARAGAARALERAAAASERAAVEAGRRADSVRSALASSASSAAGAEAEQGAGVADALRRGDVGRAADAVARLAGRRDELTPSERERAAKELEQLAQDLDELRARQQQEQAIASDQDRGPDADSHRPDPGSDATPPVGPENARKQGREAEAANGSERAATPQTEPSRPRADRTPAKGNEPSRNDQPVPKGGTEKLPQDARESKTSPPPREQPGTREPEAVPPGATPPAPPQPSEQPPTRPPNSPQPDRQAKPAPEGPRPADAQTSPESPSPHDKGQPQSRSEQRPTDGVAPDQSDPPTSKQSGDTGKESAPQSSQEPRPDGAQEPRSGPSGDRDSTEKQRGTPGESGSPREAGDPDADGTGARRDLQNISKSLREAARELSSNSSQRQDGQARPQGPDSRRSGDSQPQSTGSPAEPPGSRGADDTPRPAPTPRRDGEPRDGAADSETRPEPSPPGEKPGGESESESRPQSAPQPGQDRPDHEQPEKDRPGKDQPRNDRSGLDQPRKEQPAGQDPRDTDRHSPPQAHDAPNPAPEATQKDRAPQDRSAPDQKMPDLPTGMSPSALERLAKELKKVADSGDAVENQRRVSREMRERARKLLENADPEDLRRLSELMKPSDSAGRNEPGAAPAPHGSGASEGLTGPRPGADRPGARREWSGQSELVDARPRQEAGAPDERVRTLSQWRGEPGVDAPHDQAEGGPAGLRAAAAGAERAVEQQVVPARYGPFVKRVFKKYLERAEKAAPAPAAPALPDAPDAHPAPR